MQSHRLAPPNFMSFLLWVKLLPSPSHSQMTLFPHDKAQDTAGIWTLAQGSSWWAPTSACWAEGSCPNLKASLPRAHRETCLEVARWGSFHWAKQHEGAAGTLCCKWGAAGKRIHMRLSCSASCFYGCGRCSVVVFSPSQKAGSVSVVLTGGVFLSGEYMSLGCCPTTFERVL